MLSPRVEPVGLHTPTAALLNQMMQCLAERACVPRTIWVGCPWYCGVHPVSLMQAWRARYLLSLQSNRALTSAEPAAGETTVERLPDLKLEWPSEQRTEIIRVYAIRQLPAHPVVVPGALLDLMT